MWGMLDTIGLLVMSREAADCFFNLEILIANHRNLVHVFDIDGDGGLAEQVSRTVVHCLDNKRE